MIDRTLLYKKTAKNRNMKANLFKIVPAIAAVALVIGLVNILPAFLNLNTGGITPANEYPDTSIYVPAADQKDLFLPSAIEKSFFETKISAAVTDKSVLNKILVYYGLKDSEYILDPDMSKWEKEQILEYLREYTDLTYNDMMQMCIDNNIALPKNVDPAYAHVKFGDDDNTLLLDIEWHTYDTYMEEEVEPLIERYYERMESNAYIEGTDEYREMVDNHYREISEILEKQANEIKDKILYFSRTINGKSSEFTDGCFWWSEKGDSVNISFSGIDSNGYGIYKIFPIDGRWVYYVDENGELQQKYFNGGIVNGCPTTINSQSDYEKILKNKIIPFCDDLMSRGLITQEKYDEFTIPDLLEYYIDLYFN